MVKIAIIDTGIDIEQLQCRTIVEDAYIIDNNLIPVKVFDRSNITEQHGTICARILEKYLAYNNVDYSIIDINAFYAKDNKSSLYTEVDKLTSALELCLELKVQIVSLSLGIQIIRNIKKLENAVKKLELNNTIIIAAGDNNKKIGLPALYSHVLGVEMDYSKNLGIDQIVYSEKCFRGIQVSARCPFSDSRQSNSYTVPVVVSRIAQYIDIGINNLDEIVNELKKETPSDLLHIIEKEYKNELQCCDVQYSIPHININIEGKDDSLRLAEILLNQMSEIQYDGICIYDCEKDIQDIRFFNSEVLYNNLENAICFFEQYSNVDYIVSCGNISSVREVPDMSIYIKGKELFITNTGRTVYHDDHMNYRDINYAGIISRELTKDVES